MGSSHLLIPHLYRIHVYDIAGFNTFYLSLFQHVSFQFQKRNIMVPPGLAVYHRKSVHISYKKNPYFHTVQSHNIVCIISIWLYVMMLSRPDLPMRIYACNCIIYSYRSLTSTVCCTVTKQF